VHYWWQQVRRTVCQARDERLYWVYESVFGALMALTVQADENGGGGAET
jgi:hypothetical protein